MAACTWYSGDDLDTGAIHPFQRKMTKRQQTGIKPIATGTKHVNSGLRAKANPYLKGARQMGNSLIPASTQRTDSDLMIVT